MHFSTVLLFATLAIAVHGRPSARTFGSPQHSEHSIPAHPHDAHSHNALPGTQHDTAVHGVQAGGDSSLSILVCQVVKVPVGQSGAQPSHAAAGIGSSSVVASSVVSSSQEALSSLNSRVRTALERIVDPVVTALQNASLWLNRTSQLHLNQSHQHLALQHEHQHQHAGMANHAHNHHVHQHQHAHGGQINHHGAQGQVHNHPINPAHGHQHPQAVPNQAVPMTVVSVPVLVPAVHAGSVPLLNLSASVPASVDFPSLHFSNPGQDNATTSTPVEAVKATSQSTSTLADGNLLGLTGDLPTAPITGVTLTRAPDVSRPATLSDNFTIWFRSGTADDLTEATGTFEPTTSSRGLILTTPTSADASTTGHKPPTTVAL